MVKATAQLIKMHLAQALLCMVEVVAALADVWEPHKPPTLLLEADLAQCILVEEPILETGLAVVQLTEKLVLMD